MLAFTMDVPCNLASGSNLKPSGELMHWREAVHRRAVFSTEMGTCVT